MWKVMVCVLALGFVWGCSKDVGSTYDPLFRFPAEARWSWDEAAIRLPDDEDIRALNMDAILRETASAALAARGYVEVPPGSTAEYLLSYQASVGRVVSPTKARAVGTVSLTLVEFASGRHVWVGFARADEIDVSLTEEQRRRRVRSLMNRMLRGFPPS